MSRWINTKGIFEWDGEKYVETYAEGYDYTGELALAYQTFRSGYAGGGGGGGAGDGGNIVLITSSLTQPLIDASKIVYDVSEGDRGQYGLGGNGSSSLAGWGGFGKPGEVIVIVM